MTGREAALKALAAARKSGAWSEIYLKNLMQDGVLTGREAGLAYRICMGVLQNKTLCAYLIDSVSTIRLEKMQPMVADILLLSAYQLLLMDRIPPHAAVSEGVELCKKYGGARASGLVNAVLRRIAAMRGKPFEIRETGAKRLSILYSHPQWLVEMYMQRLGEDGCAALLAASGLCGWKTRCSFAPHRSTQAISAPHWRRASRRSCRSRRLRCWRLWLITSR